MRGASGLSSLSTRIKRKTPAALTEARRRAAQVGGEGTDTTGIAPTATGNATDPRTQFAGARAGRHTGCGPAPQKGTGSEHLYSFMGITRAR